MSSNIGKLTRFAQPEVGHVAGRCPGLSVLCGWTRNRNRNRSRNCPWKLENLLAIVKWGTDPVYYGFIGNWANIFLVLLDTDPDFWSLGIPSRYFLVSWNSELAFLVLWRYWASNFWSLGILSWFFWSCGDTEPVFSGLMEFWAGFSGLVTILSQYFLDSWNSELVFLVLWRYWASTFWSHGIMSWFFLSHGIMSWFFLSHGIMSWFFGSCGDTEPVLYGLMDLWAGFLASWNSELGFLVLWRYWASIFLVLCATHTVFSLPFLPWASIKNTCYKA